ncbi:uncharacterized protein containing a von Willebrand factor type A (vWA) domain [Saprospira grandis DSM 2844]|uniref:Uncharacterized protein containing a von Willebrand factor type A (VWA) domain n=1 Tax=Saprospira grandis DSM 2844 TaxID=694433 RepID=J0XUV9_9BACT|nr:VWA domain-containing protein [Saprospira grandis]EJF52741.1 uncharacterized protein containing a von Willebrand factor type A (vWA) domain [Saprospira grandis DSM 2844]
MKSYFLPLALISFLFLGQSCNQSMPSGAKEAEMMTQSRSSLKEEMTAADDLAEPEEPDALGDTLSDIAQNTEEYGKIIENPFLGAKDNPLSTFSIDVDNAAYSNVRRYLTQWNQLPPNGAVRLEEMINYFDYDYPQPTGEHPFSVNMELSQAPWAQEHQLLHIGLQGKDLNYDELKPSNLVFLIDCSGSMSNNNKLPLLKKGLKMLLSQLDDKDKVAIVAYAGAAGLVLPATPASQANKILSALDRLEAGGSTAGGQGIELAYKTAQEALIEGGNNRVILATDGDFNVGPSSSSDLLDLITEKRKLDIYLTICGFGMGNYKDDRMEQISNAGNGNYFYIDNEKEAQKVFVREMRANMFSIAKDVKIQIEFNPQWVKAYRLVGYENRLLKAEDFDDDTKDAGELGAGHTVTAIYEIIPQGSASTQKVTQQPALKYQDAPSIKNNSSDLMTLKLRYKPLDSDKSKLLEFNLNKEAAVEQTSDNFRFSAAVAAFGMLLRDSEFKGTANFDKVKNWALSAKGQDPNGDRAELVKLIQLAAQLKSNAAAKND